MNKDDFSSFVDGDGALKPAVTNLITAAVMWDEQREPDTTRLSGSELALADAVNVFRGPIREQFEAMKAARES